MGKTIKIRFKKYGIELWRENKPVGWKVWTLYFNPIEQLQQFILMKKYKEVKRNESDN